MTSHPLTKDQVELLKMIQNGYSSHKIAALLKCSQPNIFKKIRKLRHLGYVRTLNRSYYIADSVMAFLRDTDNPPDNHEVISRHTPDNPSADPENPLLNGQRLHNMQVKYALNSTVSEKERLYIARAKEFGTPRRRKLKHHTDVIVDWNDITFIITPKSLIVTDIEELAPQNISTYDLIFRCFSKADSVVTDLESKLRRRLPSFSLVRDGPRNVLRGEIVKIEIAHTNDVLAEHCERDDDKSRFIIYRPGTSEPDILVDHSHDTLEWEFVNKATEVDYNEKYRKFKLAFGEHERIRQWAQDFFQNQSLNPWEDRARILEIQRSMEKVIQEYVRETMELKADKERDMSAVMSQLTLVTEKLNQVADILRMMGNL